MRKYIPLLVFRTIISLQSYCLRPQLVWDMGIPAFVRTAGGHLKQVCLE